MCKKIICLGAVALLLAAADFAYGYARWRNHLGDQDFSRSANWNDPPSLWNGRIVINRGPTWDPPVAPPILSHTPDPPYAPIDVRGPGYNSGTAAEWYVTGGYLHCSGPWRICYNGNTTGYTKMTGGELVFDGDILCPNGDNCSATVQLHGGTITAGSIQFKTGGLFDLGGDGKLILDGDVTDDVKGWISSGHLKADGGLGLVVADYDSETEKTTIAATPVTAWKPRPANLAKNICPGAVLSWAPSDWAASHDVYFGADFDDVKGADRSSSAIYKGNQPRDANSFDPGALELDTTYYWRIDEVNEALLPGLWKGGVWEFKTNDGTAYNPNPTYDATKVPLDQVLSWTPGCSATSHDVYVGTDLDDVNDATRSSHPNVDYANVDVNSFDPAADFDYFTDYYWRVDEIIDSQTYKGEVYGFRTRDVIADPNLLLWYKFDETEDDWVYDSSGREFHSLDGTCSENWDPVDGRFGGSLICDDDIGLTVNPDMLTISNGVTVTVWLKDSFRSDANNTVFNAATGSDDEFQLQAHVPNAEGNIAWRAGNDTNDVLTWDLDGIDPETLEGWHHWAFVKDEVAGKISIYFDGRLAKSDDVVDSTLADVANKQFKVGGVVWHSADLIAKVDDCRVYDYALSAAEIFDLTVSYQAWSPKPSSGAQDVPRDVVLTWRPGDFATSHDVYLGTDFNDVNEADTSSSAYIGNQDANSFDPGGLELNTTYYWRIDEINDANADSPWKGKAWTFSVAEYVSIDDMESYCPGEVGGCAIMNNWLDGLENFSGATVKLGVEGTFPVHEGEQSMEFSYDNDGEVAGWPADEYSEAELELDPAEDFTNWDQLDLKALRLYFYGDPDNDANEQMYVALEDNVGAFVQVDYGSNAEDMNDVKKAEWQQWNIKLSDFSGVDLANVRKIYIGFGDRENPVAGGDGVVYFDDIRLYIQTCVAYLLQPEADLNDDCVVDMLDIEVMAVEWLDRDIAFDEMTEPSTDGLVGWWKLDDGSGDTAVDSSGQGNDGTLEALEGTVSWVAGHDGGAVEFDGGRILVPDAEVLRPTDQVSVCAWIYYPAALGEWGRVVVKGADNKESYGLQVNDDDALTFIIRDVNDKIQDLDSEDQFGLGEWIHIAGTYDGNSIKSYINGEVELSDTVGVIPLSQDPNGLGIGNRSDEPDDPFVGTIDDVRVYNRALSQAELAYLASDGTGLVSMQSPANLHDKESAGDRAVNFKDYAVLINGWLEQKLWPPEE